MTTLVWYLIIGFLGGLCGGMGMGGGTFLIPLLTLVLGVEQKVAQLCNLLAFLPMAMLSLMVHKRNGLLKTEGILWLLVPSTIFAALGAILAIWLPASLLKKIFGLFLLTLALYKCVLIVRVWLAEHHKTGQ